MTREVRTLSLGRGKLSVNGVCARLLPASQSATNNAPMEDTASASPTNSALLNSYRRWWRVARTSFFWILLIAFSVRVATILISHSYKFRTNDDNFSFGWEMGRVGRALAAGEGFSSPFNQRTGPTAWEPPLYPFLIASVFRFFGIYSHASAFVLLVTNSIFSALTCIPVFLIAKRIFGERVAVWSVWTWALLPYVTYWCTRWVWETSLSTLLLTVLVWLTLVMEERDGLKPWLEFGVLWGISALTNTSVLAFLPVSGVWIWYHRWKVGKKSLVGVVLASVIFFALISPWLYRNYKTFGQVIFIRSNFGAELRLGNGPGANGTWMEYLHPTQNVHEMRRYMGMGEIAYVAERKKEATEFIREDWLRFLGLDGKRFIYFWAGLPRLSEIPGLAQVKNFLTSSVLCFWGLGRALRKRKQGAWLLFLLILFYPAVYYITFPHPRYRHPIDPEIGMLGVFLISEIQKKRERQDVD
jgi:4-amino-4-deoxy-L-arabinose transferase-like glycosyltransferase